MSNISTIKNLAIGIKTGILPDGTPFDLLEFLKRVPFKHSKNFLVTIIEFMEKNTSQEYNIMISYISKNKLNSPDAFTPLNIKSLYKIKTSVYGVDITNEDNDIIIDYLKVNNIPVINKAYLFARNKYLSGEISAETVKTQKEQLCKKMSKKKVLIPSNKKIYR